MIQSQTKIHAQPNHWVFSARQDLLIAILVLLIGGFAQTTGLREKNLLLLGLSLPLIPILYDATHAASTLVQVYWDKTEFQKEKVLFILGPILCFAISFGMFASGDEGLVAIIWGTLASFHSLRQEYGLIAKVTAKDPFIKAKNFAFQKFLFGTFIFAGFAHLIANPAITVIWLDFNMNFLSPALTLPLFALSMLSLLTVLVFDFFHYYSSGVINLAKWFRIFLVLFIYGILSYDFGGIGLEYIVALHGVTYLFLNSKRVRKDWSKKDIKGWKHLKKGFSIKFYFLNVAIVVVILGLSTTGLDLLESDGHWGAILLASVFPTMSFTHFYLDAIIWRRSYMMRS